ncbi:hypothetical protein BC567DRAFT_251307 [Phyllosticta citribraziliensis]
MEMNFAILCLVYTVLATATSSAAAGNQKIPSSNSQAGPGYGLRGGQVILKADCTSDADCSGGHDGKKGACQRKEEYLAVVDEGEGSPESLACAAAKVLTGQCGAPDLNVKGKCSCYAPNDAACAYLINCPKFDPPVNCGPGNHVPNAVIDDTGEALCACPGKCDEARAGFQKGGPPQDECTPKGQASLKK